MTLTMKTPFILTLLLAVLALLLLDKQNGKQPARKPEPMARPSAPFNPPKADPTDHVGSRAARPTRTIDTEALDKQAAEAFNRGANNGR